MKRFLLFIIIVGLGVGAYFYFGKNGKTEAETDGKGQESFLKKPVYEQEFEKGNYKQVLIEMEKTDKDESVPKDANYYYFASESALKLSKNEKAEDAANILIEKYSKNIRGQENALSLGNDFYAAFAEGEKPNYDFWVVTRDLLGIGLTAAQNQTEVMNKIDKLNAVIEFSSRIIKGTVRYNVKEGDTLTKIAITYKTTAAYLQMINNIERASSLQIGQTIKVVPGGTFHILVKKSNYMLYLFRNGIYLKSYKVGIGKEGEDTPTGKTTITTKQIHPPWTPLGKPSIKYGEPGYPLGERWLGFDKTNFSHYGIHGTDAPETIGTKSSNGCVRLKNEDVIELFNIVPRGTTVEIKE